VTLTTGITDFAAVGVEFAMPMPRTDSRAARAKNDLNFLMATLLETGR
jgi:hypothetical protein